MNKNILKFLFAMIIFNMLSLNVIYGNNLHTEKNIVTYSLNNFFTDYYNCLTNLETKDLSSYFRNSTSEEKNSYDLFYEALRLEINILIAENSIFGTDNKCNYTYYNDIKDFKLNNNFATVSLNQEVKVTNSLKNEKTNTVYKEYNIKLVKNNNKYLISTIDTNSYYVDLLKSITPKDGNYRESADLYLNETKNLMNKNNSSNASTSGDDNPFSLKNILSYVTKMFSK